MIETPFDDYASFNLAWRRESPLGIRVMSGGVETIMNESGEKIGEFSFATLTGKMWGKEAITALPPISMSTLAAA